MYVLLVNNSFAVTTNCNSLLTAPMSFLDYNYNHILCLSPYIQYKYAQDIHTLDDLRHAGYNHIRILV